MPPHFFFVRIHNSVKQRSYLHTQIHQHINNQMRNILHVGLRFVSGLEQYFPEHHRDNGRMHDMIRHRRQYFFNEIRKYKTFIIQA